MMVEPTQQQIEAAAKAIAALWGTDNISNRDIAKAALTAAAGVDRDAFTHHSVDFQEGIREGTVATIERCAQVVNDKADEWGVGLGADIARELAAAIRSLKDDVK